MMQSFLKYAEKNMDLSFEIMHKNTVIEVYLAFSRNQRKILT